MSKFFDKLRFPALCLALVLPASAHAQAYQCRLPQGPVTVPQIERDGPVRRMPITGYTLSLSWSPEYCRFRGTRDVDRTQCSGDNGRFGLVLHGLWPEGRGARWPQWCSLARSPSPATLRAHICMTPSARLMAHEWAKHGSCMVRKPETYFRIASILWKSLRLPDLDRLSREPDLTAGQMRARFADANGKYWSADMVGLDLNRRGWLEQIRLCYDKDFMPAACDRLRFGPPDSAPVKIWRGL